MLALGKRLGLSFAELSDLRVQDLLAMGRSFFGVEDDGPREATQADIDAYFAS